MPRKKKSAESTSSSVSRTRALLDYFGLYLPGTGKSKGSSSQTDQAVSIIRDRILDLSLPPGAHIDARVLVSKYGMGRTPAREAMNRLAAEGLIIIQRNRGAFVRPMDITEIREFFDAYIASERVVAYYCRTDDEGLTDDLLQIEQAYQDAYANERFLEMTRLNGSFHGRLAVATHNEYVAEQALRLYNHSRRLAYFTSQGGRKNFIDEMTTMQAKIEADHNDIISIVKSGKNDKLIEVLTSHVELFKDSVTRVLLHTHSGLPPLPRNEAAAP